MGNIDTAKILTRVGAILLIISGFLQIGWSAFQLFLDVLWGYWIFSIVFDATMLVFGIITIIFGFLILFMFFPKIDENPKNAGIMIIIFGIIAGFGGWYIGWIGSILCIVAAILIFIEVQSGEGA